MERPTCLRCLEATKSLQCPAAAQEQASVLLRGDEQHHTALPAGRAVPCTSLSKAELISRTLLCLATSKLLWARAALSPASPWPEMCWAGKVRSDSSARLHTGCRDPGKAWSSHPARRAAGYLFYMSQLPSRRTLPLKKNYTGCQLKNNTNTFPLQNGLWHRRITVSFPRQNNEVIATKEWNTFFYYLDNSVSFSKDLIKQPVKL